MTMTAEKLTDPAFVVFGIDAAKKPRAARFDNSQPKLVAKAAELMKLQVCEVSSPAVAAVAKKLPEGRLYANGNGFIPSVRHGVYATLAATIAAANRAAGPKGAGAAAGSPGLPPQLGQDRAGPPGDRQRRGGPGLVGRHRRCGRWRHADLALAGLPLAARRGPAPVNRRLDQAWPVRPPDLLWLRSIVCGLSHGHCHQPWLT